MASFVHPDARVVVEFGAGTGNTTTAILQNLPLNAKLISFEIHPPFIAALRAIKDKRLLIIDDVAQNASDHLRRLEIYTVDSIVSSLPLRVIPELEREAILSTAKDILADDGNFIQFLYWFGKNPPLKEDLLDHHFSCQKEILVLRNIPPAKAYNMKPKEMASYHRRQAKYASL
jgi:phospholipid N-methyltransferase